MNTDKFMVDTWLSLARDFRAISGTSLAREQEDALKVSITAFRECSMPGRMQAPVMLHKQLYQLESLFKRYIFSSDKFTNEMLQQNACEDFSAFQAALTAPRKPLRLTTQMVVTTARRLIREVLGPYEYEEHMRLCQFGKRAVVGVPAARAYLDEKVRVMPCSSRQFQWFCSYLRTDKILKEVIKENGRNVSFPFADCLNLVNVPKKYNTLRSIMPNTGLGAFITSGLGKYVELKLRSAACDIRTLQEKHKRLAQTSSRTRHLVTLDLKKASENFTSDIVNRFVPRDWYYALKDTRICQCRLDGVEGNLTLGSFMAMGIGYTFPLQTLIYKSVIEAIALLLGVKGTISVYGDDCIYPRKIHRYVLSVLKDLGFQANPDKTFSTHFFRESCGGDYYRGVDVRPYSPEGQYQELRGAKLEAFLYKTLNGLLRRWDAAEIPRTVHMILVRIASSCGRIYQVPTSFPDTAGVKVREIQTAWHMPWSDVYWLPEEGNYAFPYLLKVSKDRVVRSCYPFYWNAMRISSLSSEEDDTWHPWDESATEQLRWVNTYPAKFVTSRITKQRMRKMTAVVASKVEYRYSPRWGTTILGKWCID